MKDKVQETPPPAYDIAVLKLNSPEKDTKEECIELQTLSQSAYCLPPWTAQTVQTTGHTHSSQGPTSIPPAYDNLSSGTKQGHHGSSTVSSTVPYFNQRPSTYKSHVLYEQAGSFGHLSTRLKDDLSQSTAISSSSSEHKKGSRPITLQPGVPLDGICIDPQLIPCSEDLGRQSMQPSSLFLYDVTGSGGSEEVIAADSTSSTSSQLAVCELTSADQVTDIYVQDTGLVNAKVYLDYVSLYSSFIIVSVVCILHHHTIDDHLLK